MNRYFSLRLLAIHVLGALSVVACLALAYWQWDRAQAYVPPASATALTFEELSPLRDYLPASSVGVPTFVTGTWQPDERILMPERVIDGKSMVNPDPEIEVISKEKLNENYTMVSSILVGTEQRPEVKIDWRIYTKNPENPLIRDLIIEGLSLARTQKEEFSSIIQSNDGDINALFSILKEFIK